MRVCHCCAGPLPDAVQAVPLPTHSDHHTRCHTRPHVHARSHTTPTPHSRLQPAHAANEGTVRFCCCVPRGKVALTCDFDKAAYAGGETAQIKAVVANSSKNDVRSMKVGGAASQRRQWGGGGQW